MSDHGRPYQQFFAELKRRHVFKVAAIYGATAFVLLQVADLLALASEKTPDGVRRTEETSASHLGGSVTKLSR